MRLSLEAAADALARAGAPLGFGADETAAAAARIVDNQMADAIRLASVQQGYDPRGSVIYAYGGAGPVHAPAIAPRLGITRLTVPLGDLAAGWSAFGVASSDAMVVEELSSAMEYPFDIDALNAGFAALETRVLERMARQGIAQSAVTLRRTVEMRYSLQVNTVSVTSPAGALADTDAVELVSAFEREYERLFGEGTGYADAGFVINTLRVSGRARLHDRAAPLAQQNGAPSPLAGESQVGERGVIFYEYGLERVATPLHDGTRLRVGTAVDGPAIIEFPDTTLVLRANQQAVVEPLGSISVEL
jgi:N-methylhydantoinase A